MPPGRNACCSAPASRPCPAAGRKCSPSRWRLSTSSPDGRAVLGAGIGGNRREFEEFGESFDTERRWQLLESGLELIRELWAGPLGPREIPIWIGGNSTRARHLAGRYDGWLPDSTTPEEMRMSPEDIRDETQREIGVMGYSSPGELALHDAYANAGTTWWLESLHNRRGSLEELLARVRAGP